MIAIAYAGIWSGAIYSSCRTEKGTRWTTPARINERLVLAVNQPLSIVVTLLALLAGCHQRASERGSFTREALPDGVWMVVDDPVELGHMWGEIEETGEPFDDYTFGMRCLSRDKEIQLLFDNCFVGNPFGLQVGDRFRFERSIESMTYNEDWEGYYALKREILPVEEITR
ncbi:hypothetical protein [Stieleria magnilauensis]|uniref:Lipoprotein n=1 Tax=Stieleria magnilauensis TaxID=2527963 RepID=A0ABX5XU54_9BACT|nr:hypothetical protein TBK1r_40810 [Planctomycetes bacterium TBK1r]